MLNYFRAQGVRGKDYENLFNRFKSCRIGIQKKLYWVGQLISNEKSHYSSKCWG